MGELYFGEKDWNGKAASKIRANIQSVTDLRGLQIAAKELEEKLRLDIQANAAVKMTPEELENLCWAATERLDCAQTKNLAEVVDDPLIEIYKAVCCPIDF